MPAEAWYVLIAAVLVAVALALWKGRGLTLRHGREGTEIGVKEPAPGRAQVKVAEGAVFKSGSKARDLIGVSGAAPDADVEVLSHGKVEGEIGSVIGVDDGRRRPSDE